jgi:hypothetical protein
MNTKAERIIDAQADGDAIRILRRLYAQVDSGSDVLFNARMYLADRARYERLPKVPQEGGR